MESAVICVRSLIVCSVQLSLNNPSIEPAWAPWAWAVLKDWLAILQEKELKSSDINSASWHVWWQWGKEESRYSLDMVPAWSQKAITKIINLTNFIYTRIFCNVTHWTHTASILTLNDFIITVILTSVDQCYSNAPIRLWLVIPG